MSRIPRWDRRSWPPRSPRVPLLDTGSPILFAVGIAGTYAILGVFYGPLASFIPEIFATRYRYTGAGLAFNLAGIVGGAVPPLISAALLAAYGSWAIARRATVTRPTRSLDPSRGAVDLADPEDLFRAFGRGL